MAKSSPQSAERVIEFLRKRDYIFVKELGSGACGKTVLLRDDTLDQYFVCKKYAPLDDLPRKELFDGFVREIKLLHLLHHPNLVRVFNYYLYPDSLSGYIVLEHVDGVHIDDYIRSSPEQINETFLQVISAFSYLEQNNILHRDVRPANVMVTGAGVVKVIDLGFGKRIGRTKDFDKSISLNWWCDPPEEFGSARYDFGTEVYFVGKLFEKLVQDGNLEQFKYRDLLSRMCQWKHEQRLRSFADAERSVDKDRFYEIEFADQEIQAYREFAGCLAHHVTKIAKDAKYVEDIDRIQHSLEATYQRVMLSAEIPDAELVITSIVDGGYYYKSSGFPTDVLGRFVRLMKSVSIEKRRIIMTNMWANLDAVRRYDPKDEQFDDDIPF